jgi:circadian clock protein KaiB
VADANRTGPAEPGSLPDAPSEPSPDRYLLRLYVAGMSPRSRRALESLRDLLERVLAGNYDLEVVDIYQEPDEAEKNQIVAAPTLIKSAPNPVKILVGDMSDTRRLLIGLDVAILERHGLQDDQPADD